MKALGNQARLEILATGKVPYSASAKAAYQAEVDSLNAKLNRQRATPRATTSISKAKQNKIATMNASGYTIS